MAHHYRRASARWAAAVAVLTLVQLTSSVSSSASRSALREGCIDAVRPAVSDVILHLADRVGIARQAREEMLRETIAPWQTVGVNVRWSTNAPAGERAYSGTPQDAYENVSVIITRHTVDDALRSMSSMRRRLASILFVDGKPTTLISAYPMEVERLLNIGRLHGKMFEGLLPKLQYRLTGRVLGRAVAHELGHFLFASADHASFGLMRATLPTDDLLTPSHDALQVIAPQPPLHSQGCGETRP